MRLEIASDDLGRIDKTAQDLVVTVVRSEVDNYLLHNYHYYTDRWNYTEIGEKALEYEITDVVRSEVQSVVREHIDKIVTKAIRQTAMSIKKNPHYDELRAMIAKVISENEEEQGHE